MRFYADRGSDGYECNTCKKDCEKGQAQLWISCNKDGCDWDLCPSCQDESAGRGPICLEFHPLEWRHDRIGYYCHYCGENDKKGQLCC